MAGPAPKTDKWTARENKDNDSTVLIVTGQVEVGDPSQRPVLKEAGGGGNKPLLLDLSLPAPAQAGAKMKVWMLASFTKDVKTDQHNDIVIRWDGKQIGACRVLDDKEHGRHIAALTRAANAEVAEGRAEGALRKAKRAAAKAEKRVKKVAKRVKNTVKRAAKAVRAAARIVGKGAKKKAKGAKKKTKKVARKVKSKAKGRKKRA